MHNSIAKVSNVYAFHECITDRDKIRSIQQNLFLTISIFLNGQYFPFSYNQNINIFILLSQNAYQNLKKNNKKIKNKYRRFCISNSKAHQGSSTEIQYAFRVRLSAFSKSLIYILYIHVSRKRGKRICTSSHFVKILLS